MRLIVLSLFFILSVTPCYAAVGNVKAAKEALKLMEQSKWDQALSLAKSQPVLTKIILWQKYKKASGANFSEITNFIAANPKWPAQDILRCNAENAINASVSDVKILQWFKIYPPLSSAGRRHYVLAQMRSNKEWGALLKNVWYHVDLSAEEEQQIVSKYGKFLTKADYIEKANHLLMGGNIAAAKKLSAKLDQSALAVMQARIKLQKAKGKNPATSLTHLPEHMMSDPALAHDLVMFHQRAGNEKSTKDLLIKMQNSANFGADKLWDIKFKTIRQLIEANDFACAYNLAKNHASKDPANYVDGEWMAGWIALRFLEKPTIASVHFVKLYNKAKTPISKARGSYWAARSYGQNNMPKEAAKYYAIAAKYSDIFYGQLAILKTKSLHKMHFPKHVNITAQDRVNFQRNAQVQVAELFIRLKQQNMASLFIKNAIKTASSPGEMALISEFCHKIQTIHLSVVAAKEARQHHSVLLTKHNYPQITKLPKLAIEKSLTHAIIRQESVFDQHALSSAGARGLMQLLPSTAHDQAKASKLTLKTHQLQQDKDVNITLGSAYLHKLINYYDGSYILAIAAYNGGIGNVAKWIVKYGDPRKLTNIHDVIDWIEMIPFKETRNYVQRVMENLQVYRHLYDANDYHITRLEEDLARQQNILCNNAK
jgi:soluble lytic murein transglycosylase